MSSIVTTHISLIDSYLLAPCKCNLNNQHTRRLCRAACLFACAGTQTSKKRERRRERERERKDSRFCRRPANFTSVGPDETPSFDPASRNLTKKLPLIVQILLGDDNCNKSGLFCKNETESYSKTMQRIKCTTILCIQCFKKLLYTMYINIW